MHNLDCEIERILATHVNENAVGERGPAEAYWAAFDLNTVTLEQVADEVIRVRILFAGATDQAERQHHSMCLDIASRVADYICPNAEQRRAYLAFIAEGLAARNSCAV